MIFKTPIWEPKGTHFRPYNLSTLVSFYIGRAIRGFFRFILGEKTEKDRK